MFWFYSWQLYSLDERGGKNNHIRMCNLGKPYCIKAFFATNFIGLIVFFKIYDIIHFVQVWLPKNPVVVVSPVTRKSQTSTSISYSRY